MGRLLALLLALFAMPLLHAQAGFDVQAVQLQENPVALTIHPGNRLQTLQAELDGVPCTLLFDTGASHTTFNLAFLQRAFPDLVLSPLPMGGTTNIRKQPMAFVAKRLRLGNTTLRDFAAVALALDHLSAAIGTPIDGILGVNAMAYAPFRLSLKRATVTWSAQLPEAPEAAALTVLPAASPIAPLTLALPLTDPEGRTRMLPLLLDSGSTYTFLPRAQWPQSGERLALATADVNAAAAAQVCRGQPARLALARGQTLHLSPLLTESDRVQLGADFLLAHDLLCDVKARVVKVVP